MILKFYLLFSCAVIAEDFVYGLDDIPVFKEIGKHHVMFFEKGNINQLANIMLKTSIYKHKYNKEYLREARNYANQFTWEKTATKTLAVYKKII